MLAANPTSHEIAAYPLWSASMRKLLLALFTMFIMAGLVVAVDVTVVSYDKEKKELIYKEKGSKDESKATVGKDAKFKTTDFKGENPKDSDYEAFEKYVSSKGKGKGGRRVDITVKDGTITEATWRAGGKKKKDKE
jgi:hypothetical protein